jgi:hypothetical protein
MLVRVFLFSENSNLIGDIMDAKRCLNSHRFIFKIFIIFVFLIFRQNIFAADSEYWTTMTSGTTNLLNGVWGNSSNDVFAVGYSGTILHYRRRTANCSGPYEQCTAVLRF